MCKGDFKVCLMCAYWNVHTLLYQLLYLLLLLLQRSEKIADWMCWAAENSCISTISRNASQSCLLVFQKLSRASLIFVNVPCTLTSVHTKGRFLVLSFQMSLHFCLCILNLLFLVLMNREYCHLCSMPTLTALMLFIAVRLCHTVKLHIFVHNPFVSSAWCCHFLWFMPLCSCRFTFLSFRQNYGVTSVARMNNTFDLSALR